MAVDAIKYAAFTCATMANNHILYFCADGLRKTVCCCQSRGLNVVGAGDNLDGAGRVLYLEKDGKRLAVINCCEYEFSVATETSAGANPLNPIRQFYSIQEAKKLRFCIGYSPWWSRTLSIAFTSNGGDISFFH